MASKVFVLPEGVKVTSSWPYEVMPKAKRSSVREGWNLAISIDADMNGLVVYYPSDTDAPSLRVDGGPDFPWGKEIKFRQFWRVETPDEARKFCVTFCSRGYTDHPDLLPYQDGILWGFNWSSQTVATVKIASRIAFEYFKGTRDGAWDEGRAFEREIRRAEQEAYAASVG